MKFGSKITPQTNTKTSPRLRIVQYSVATLGLAILIAIGIWLYFQMGQQENGRAAAGGNPPVNDVKAQAEWLTDLFEDQSTFAAYTTTNATSDALAGNCFTNGAQNGVWFKFQALHTEVTVTVKTGGAKGTIQNAEMALFNSSNNEVACGSASGTNNLTINLTGITQDEWYYILVDTKNPSDTGSFTLYINNVSPIKYYTRDKGDWDNNSTWSTTGFSGSTAGTLPGKANVIFIQDLNGDLEINGYTAACAGVVYTSGNKKSKLKIKGGGTLNVFGRHHMNGTGSREMDLEIDDGTLYVQDSLLIEKKGGYKEARIDVKDGMVTVERTMKTDHTSGKGVKVDFDNNSTLNVDGDLLFYNQGGYDGMEISLKKTDATVGGLVRSEYNGGSGDVIFKYKEDGNLTIGDNLEFYRDGGTNKFDVQITDNITVNVTNDFSFVYNSGNSEVDYEFSDNSNMTIGGDFTMDMDGGSNKFDIRFEDNVDVSAAGNASMSMNGGSASLEIDIKTNAHLSFGGNFAADKSNGSNAVKINLEDGSYIESGSTFSALHSGGNNGVEISVGKNNAPAHIKTGGNFEFGSPDFDATIIELEDQSYLEVKGDVKAMSTRGRLDFKESATQLRLTGNGIQHVVGESTANGLEINYRNILVNNTYTSVPDTTPSVILDGPVNLEEQIDLSDGIVKTTANNLLTIDQNASVTGGSDGSFVDGPVNKIGSTDFKFPVGNRGVYAPIKISSYSNSSGSNEFQAQYFFNGYPDTATGNNLEKVSAIEYWNLNKIVGSGSLSAKIELFWNDGSRSGISNLNDLTIGGYNGSQWTSLEPTSVTGSVTSGSIETDNGQNNFGQFTFGSIGGGNILPIELTSFEAQLTDHKQVLLTWETAVEINNDYFTVERSRDGEVFEEVGTVVGAGNSQMRKTYELLDTDPYNGTSYYRLKQTDFDGQYAYFPVESVTLSKSGKQSGVASINKIYPNPFSDQLVVSLDADEELSATITLHGINGQQYALGNKTLNNGNQELRWSGLSQIPAGTYILTIETSRGTVTEKVIKSK